MIAEILLTNTFERTDRRTYRRAVVNRIYECITNTEALTYWRVKPMGKTLTK